MEEKQHSKASGRTKSQGPHEAHARVKDELKKQLQMLSGAETPIEGQPDWLQPFTLLLPSRHFVGFAQAVIFKGAGFDVVWPQFLALGLMGLGLLGLSLARFRATVAAER